jgi:hypothetical protein
MTSLQLLMKNEDGFPAANGWDPVSGWGTPAFLAMKSLALAV